MYTHPPTLFKNIISCAVVRRYRGGFTGEDGSVFHALPVSAPVRAHWKQAPFQV